MPRVDLAILFALREEFDAFFPSIAKSSSVETDKKTGRSFFLFDWAQENSPPYHCLTTFVGTMGAQDASLVTALILLLYSPANVVLVGIAGGLSDDVLIGDVVIADEVRDYLQDGKVGDAGFSPSGRSYRASGRTNNILRYLDRAKATLWSEIQAQSESDVQKILQTHQIDTPEIIRPNGFKIHVGHVASGPVVGASEEFAGWLKTQDRKFVAIEMESAGFMNAAYEFAADGSVMVIRGISDKGKANKATLDKIGSGVLRRLAMSNALRALTALVVTDSLTRAPEPVADEDDWQLVGPISTPGLSYPASYGDIQLEFRNRVYRSTPRGLRSVRVFGFTYAVFWTLMREMLTDPSLTDWTFDLHCISPEFVKANASLLSEPWLADSVNRSTEMKGWFAVADNVNSLKKRNVNVRLRTFDVLPFLHGKLFADGTIFFHSAQWNQSGRLNYPNTFHEIIPDKIMSARATAYRGLFGNWMDKYDNSIHETIFASTGIDWSAFESDMRNRILRIQGQPDVR